MIKSFEGGRGLAAMLVALFHLQIWAGHIALIRNGYLFVDLFFVLSGFVICGAYTARINTRADFCSFMLRRFGRLFPLLIFSTIAFVLARNFLVLGKNLAAAHGYIGLLKDPSALEYLVPTVAEILATLTFTHSMGLFDKLILNIASWSISTEFYAYVLFAALCLTLQGLTRLKAFAFVSLIGFAVTVWATIGEPHSCLTNGGCFGITYDYGFARCVCSFFLGALAYYTSRSLNFNPVLLQLTGMTGLAVLFLLVDTFPAAAFSFPLIFALLVISVSRDTGPLADLLKCKPFQILGQRSYSIYMMHPILLMFLFPLANRGKFWMDAAVLIVYVTLILLLSAWTYRFIEEPFRRRFNRIADGYDKNVNVLVGSATGVDSR